MERLSDKYGDDRSEWKWGDYHQLYFVQRKRKSVGRDEGDYPRLKKGEKAASFFLKKATYHPSCHLPRMLRDKEEYLTLLHNVEGLELIDLPYQLHEIAV